MKLLRNQEIVPVLTFHSIGMDYEDWIWSHLSEPADLFERLLARLADSGYSTVTLEQLYAHMAGDERCAPKSIVLVFDDGYLDNWVVVAPLLRKYGMTGAVYVNPEFVEPGDALRPTIDDHAGGNALERRGFMNWAELRELDRSGTLDVQSHSMSHTWYYVGGRVEDGYAPDNAKQYPWMAWNARPERKPYYLNEDQSDFVAWGTPVLQFEKSIIARRFHPEQSVMSDIVEQVRRNGGRDFFGRPDWRNDYREIVRRSAGGEEIPGELERENDARDRVRWELAESKARIEANLGKQVDFLCWPGGGVDDAAKRLALDAGYRSWTLPGGDASGKRNVPGSDPSEIKRVPAMRDVVFFGRTWGLGTERLMWLDLLAHQDSALFGWLRKAYKMSVAAGVAGR